MAGQLGNSRISPAEWNRLIARIHRPLLYYIRRILRRSVLEFFPAVDIAQETYLEALLRSGQFRGSSDVKFYAWIKCIARGVAMNCARAQGRRKRNWIRHLFPADLREFNPESKAPCAERSVETEDMVSRVKALLRSHRHLGARIVLLVYLKEEPIPRIALQMGLSVAAIRKHIRREFKWLRAQLDGA